MKPKTRKYITRGLIVSALITGIVLFQQHRVKSYDNTHIRVAQQVTHKYNRKTKRFTLAHVEEHIDATEPNIGSAMTLTNAKLNKGLSLAFNDSHTMSDYESNQGRIKRLLGHSISSKVLPIVQPVVNADSGSSKRSMSQAMTLCKISYGKFDEQSSTVPIVIAVKYRTPPMDPEAGAGAQVSHTKRVRTGTVFMSGTFMLRNRTIQLNTTYSNMSGK